MDRVHGVAIGAIIECEGGRMVIPNYSKAVAYDEKGREVRSFDGSKNHFANFIDAVRSRKVEDLNADIVEGHVSSALCHVGNVSYVLGQDADPAEIAAGMEENAAARETLDRLLAHLDANEVDAKTADLRLGPWLAVDVEAERFGDARANALLSRDYREGFAVPAAV